MSVLQPASSSASPRPQPNRHLLAEDLDAMLTRAVLEASDEWDDALDQPARDRLVDSIRALVRPAWLLTPVRDGGPAESGDIGGSRVGGVPDLPRGWQWPTTRIVPRWEDEGNATEAALAFTAQINLARVPGVADAGWLPSSGWLWFFRDEKEAAPSRPGHVVLHADVPLHELRTIRPPDDLDYLGGLGLGPELDRPVRVSPHRGLFLTANYKAGWQSRGYDALAEALDEQLDEMDAGFEVFADVQRLLNAAAVGDRPWTAMLLGRPASCPPAGGTCPCGRSAPSDVPGHSHESGPCAGPRDSLLALYDRWGDGPLVFTADATAPPAMDDNRWADTGCWVH
ncbi:DUF1963 domain-containing protein [Streptomyces sp. NPDC051018]|uniref:DUF1963 domain-containing protein n=1 Tax=Streptomyces sp. NPDC051018 TaxID=3365639 RepID=UPI0037919BB7